MYFGRVLSGLVAIALSACVIIPTPEHGLRSGLGAITEADMTGLVVGETTREEVLLRFGEPLRHSKGGRHFVYAWSVKAGYWYMGGAYQTAVVPGDEGDLARNYWVTLEFDAQGVLTHKERARHTYVAGTGTPRSLVEGRPESVQGGRLQFVPKQPQSGRDIDSSIAEGERFSLEDLNTEDGQTRIFVFRPGDMTGVIGLQIDDEHRFDLQPGGFVITDVNPGKHAIHYHSHRQKWGWETLPLSTKPDEKVFIKMSFSPTMRLDAKVKLKIVPEERAIDEIMKTRRSAIVRPSY